MVFIPAILSVRLLPLRDLRFLGGSADHYLTNPVLWGWANFDGDYYLKIAIHGYQSLTHSFFPLYPLLAKYLAFPFGAEVSAILVAGLVISNMSFLALLFVFWKLIRMDYSEKTALLSLVLLLAFPTSFYFGAMYTESLFLLLTIGAFYAARKKMWFFAGVLGMLASATRIVGIFLLPALIIEWFWGVEGRKKPSSILGLLFLLLIPMGLGIYMFFLQKTTGNPFAFYNELAVFGEQRSGQFIPLYQVFWRYLKMLLTARVDPIYLTILMEAVVGGLGLMLIIWGYLKKMRPSYLVFSFLSYVLPTLTGSFSSFPRYFLGFFPMFIALALLFSEKYQRYQLIYFILSLLLLAIETALFVRGYWVA